MEARTIIWVSEYEAEGLADGTAESADAVAEQEYDTDISYTRSDIAEAVQAENTRLRELLIAEIDDGRAEVDDIGPQAWIEAALNPKKEGD